MIKNDDSKGFAEGILQLIRDPELAKRLVNSSKRDTIDFYNWDRIAQEIEKVYEEVSK